MKANICRIRGREVLDSRGNPTVQVDVFLENNAFGRATVPSGASTGTLEALELRDKDPMRYKGKGVLKAVQHVSAIEKALLGQDALNQSAIDKIMLDLDGTDDKSNLGANAILGVSMAIARAGAASVGLPLFKYLGGIGARILPVPMMNVLNGGVHADSGLAVQEFMIVPHGFESFSRALRAGVEVYHTLKSLLKSAGHSVAVGAEGGFAPRIPETKQAMDFLVKAITEAGYKPGQEVSLALDPAASEFHRDGKYHIDGSALSSQEMVEFYQELVEGYPVISIEDGLAEDDWEGWALLTQALGEKTQLVGDDIFVTNRSILEKAVAKGVANSILIKLNQIGTVSETVDTVRTAKTNAYTTVISHRSGETGDTFIADFAVAVGAGMIKTGAPARSERVEKYNRLLQIEEELEPGPVFLGAKAFAGGSL